MLQCITYGIGYNEGAGALREKPPASRRHFMRKRPVSLSAGRSPQDLPALTSLRFVAAMMIVVLHCRTIGMPLLWLKHAPGTLVHGVSFFFVLSGFILTHVYRSRGFPGYGRFIALRIGRLWPVHALAIGVLLISIVSPLAIVRTDSITFDGAGIFSRWFALGLGATMTQSLSPYFAHLYSWNAPSWTISTEFVFYLAFPFLLPDIERTWRWKLALSALLVVAVLSIAHFSGLPYESADLESLTQRSITYANPLLHAFEFCLGMSAWVVWNRTIRGAGGHPVLWSIAEIAAVALAGAWLYSELFWKIEKLAFTRLWFNVAGSCWVFAIVIVTLAGSRGYLGKLLSLAPFVFLGEISYSIYIFHQILLKVFFTHGWIGVPSPVYFVAIFALSSLTYFLVERPARSYVARLVKPPPGLPAADDRSGKAGPEDVPPNLDFHSRRL
jgi:peptidoglycan/LPS O-acetylase OafA/YrhL